MQHAHKGVTMQCQQAQNCPGTDPLPPAGWTQTEAPIAQDPWTSSVGQVCSCKDNPLDALEFGAERQQETQLSSGTNSLSSALRRIWEMGSPHHKQQESLWEVLSLGFSGEPFAAGGFQGVVSVAVWPPNNWGFEIKGNQNLCPSRQNHLLVGEMS